MSRVIALVALAVFFTGCASTSALPQSPAVDPPTKNLPVTLTTSGEFFILSNAFCTAQVNMHTGELWSLKYRGIETMGYVSGHHAGYWEQLPRPGIGSITIDPKSNSGARAEVSVKGFIPGFTLEERYSMGRDDHGIYTYAIFAHPASYPNANLGESRFGAKLNGQVFDWLSIDAQRNKKMASGFDWDHGTPLNMKEARRLTTGIYAGQPEHKYDYSACQFKIPAFGWSSTTQHIGLYFINPSMEYLSCGPTHYELTGHLDDGQGGDPTLLNYWRGSHYGGSMLQVSAGEQWSKVVGPMLVYLDSAATPDEMFKNALAQAQVEASKWPYPWIRGADYPQAAQRTTVTGHITVNDPLAPVPMTEMKNLLVGLAYPDAQSGSSGRFGQLPLTWQNDAKHYEFWVRGNPDGSFSIPNVRAGTYELHAIADGILGEFSQRNITIPNQSPGSLLPGDRSPHNTLNLGPLTWRPVRYGRQLWDIGIPNRDGSEFLKGDDYFHWGMYVLYAQLFPHDVDFTIGKSDYRKDWYFEQVPHAINDNGTGRSMGRATPWTIRFTLPEALRGRAILRLAIAGVGARSISVAVNGRPAGVISGLMYNATINRDGIGGAWVERDLAFDAALLHPGPNAMTLTIPAGGLTSGVIYDYLRLELQ